VQRVPVSYPQGRPKGDSLLPPLVSMLKALLFDLDNTLILYDEPAFLQQYFAKISAAFADLIPAEVLPERILMSIIALSTNDGTLNNADYFMNTFSTPAPTVQPSGIAFSPSTGQATANCARSSENPKASTVSSTICVPGTSSLSWPRTRSHRPLLRHRRNPGLATPHRFLGGLHSS